ncbi:MAG: PmoA family protein, partial [Bacteroidota bacterium]
MRFFLIGFIFFWIGSGCQSKSEPLSEPHSENGITLRSANEAILTYHPHTQYPPDSLPDYYQRSGFIHPLYSPKGKILTADFPAGHTHQHGIFFALVNTEFRGRFTDFWNQQKETGTVRATAANLQGDSLLIAQHEHLALQNGDTIVALREEWQLSVQKKAAFHVVDLQSTLYPAGTDSLLIKQYKYGGLGIRGNEAWNNLQYELLDNKPIDLADPKVQLAFLTSKGDFRIAANHTRPDWIIMLGKLEGEFTGLVLMGSPRNFRFPQPVRVHPEMPYFSVSPMVLGDFVLHPGDSLVSRYRILTFDGVEPLTELDKEWRAYRFAERENR